MDNIPVALSDALRVESRAGDDLSGDRERCYSYAVWFQVGSEHGRGGPESGFAERDRGEGWDRVVCESPPVTMMVPEPAAFMAGAAAWATTMAPITSTA